MSYNEFTSERKMFHGDWQCGQCKGPIHELPFDPNPRYLDKLLCKECFKSQRRTR